MIGKKIEKYIESAKKFGDLYKLYTHSSIQKCSHKRIKLLLLNAPCNGFGDLIFAKKLADYLRNEFKISVTLATTEPEKLLMLGEKKQYLKKLASPGDAQNPVAPCRVFYNLRLFSMNGKKQESTNPYDLFFVAPLSFDYDPKLSDVHPLVPQATKFNTFFFSEYNDTTKKAFDFHTGVGPQRDGLLLTSPKIIPESRIKKLMSTSKYGPYALVYIADINRAGNCVNGFLEMISKKYNTHKNFQIVMPGFLEDDINFNILKKYWGKITRIRKHTPDDVKYGQGKHTLYIRCDILPVKNEIMMGLMRYSVRDILLTGDQSITDALSCCADNKNIFYQIAPWKINFGKQLAKNMPNKYLAKQSTSCGALSAIKYVANYKKFVKQNDFFSNVKGRINGILCIADQYRNKKSDIRNYIDTVNSSRVLSQVKKKLNTKPTRKSRVKI